MPYPGRRAHHLRGVKRRHHRPGFVKARDRQHRRRGRRVSFSARGGLNVNFVRGPRGPRRRRRGGAFRLLGHAAGLSAIARLLKHRKRRQAPGNGPTAGGSRIRLHHPRIRHARLRHPRLRHPRPLHPRPRVGRRTPQARTSGRFAVMQTNFGQNILAPARGAAYRTGNTTRVGRRQPRRRH